MTRFFAFDVTKSRFFSLIKREHRSNHFMDQSELKQAYIKYVKAHGETPKWSYQFIDPLKLDSGSFFDIYSSLSQLEQDIWNDFFTLLLARLEGEPAYLEYSAREKLLAFYFTLIEVLAGERDFIGVLFKRFRVSLMPAFLRDFKKQYLTYIKDLINQAKDEDEAIGRPIIDSLYDHGLWRQCQFIIWFWTRDQSDGYELTDAAIEKAVHLSFDLMGHTPIDSMVGFAKFLYQSR